MRRGRGFYVGKLKAGVDTRILRIYTNLLFIPKIQIDFGFERSVSLEYQYGCQRKPYTDDTRYKEYECYGIRADVTIVFFRLGIYFTPFYRKFKHKIN